MKEISMKNTFYFEDDNFYKNMLTQHLRLIILV